MIVHAEDDLDIPVWHAQLLFDAILEKHLPPLPKITGELAEASVGSAGDHLLEARATRRGELVTVREMERVGRVQEFSASGKVVFLHTWWGAHDVGLLEGVQDYMVEMFHMG